jgi:signal transduction histidine kinase
VSAEGARSCACIVAAIQGVAAKPPSDLAAMRPQDLAEQLDWVTNACIHGVNAPSETGAIASLRRHIIDLVRRDVVEAWKDDAPDSATMLDALDRLEFALRTCDVVSSDQKLNAELAGHGGISLMAEVAHDMRSPLTSIVFLSEVLQRRQLRIIYSAALGLTGLASDLIEINRSGRRRAAAPPTPFAVNGVLRSVQDLVSPIAEEKGLELVVELMQSDRRTGYPVELSRVLLNLTTNALKYTSEGGVTLSAKPVRGTAFHTLRFSVTDTGPGIDAAGEDRLYQALRHEPRRETGYAFSGTGLGLAICRRIVAWLGAELKVETSSTGTCFSFDLDLPPANPM